MKTALDGERVGKLYRNRKQTVEPAFGIIESYRLRPLPTTGAAQFRHQVDLITFAYACGRVARRQAAWQAA